MISTYQYISSNRNNMVSFNKLVVIELTWFLPSNVLVLTEETWFLACNELMLIQAT